MAGAAVLGRLTWQIGQVVEILQETPQVHSLVLDIPSWPGHRAGQHVDVRLTAEDGYQAVRSYSIASPPEDDHVVLTVERLGDGEVSPYLVDEVGVGDRFEVRGPIGGYFVWDASRGGPLLLIGGGSGIVPLMAMLRHRTATFSDASVRLLYSSRSPEDVIYAEELDRLSDSADGIEVVHTFTRAQPPGWTGYSRRVDLDMLRDVSPPVEKQPLIYVCGPTQFVESVASDLLDLGHEPGRIKTERFGPTGR